MAQSARIFGNFLALLPLSLSDSQAVYIDELEAISHKACADLIALELILIYLLSPGPSWADFQNQVKTQGIPANDELPIPIVAYMRHISTAKMLDYLTLRSIFTERSKNTLPGVEFQGQQATNTASIELYCSLRQQQATAGYEITLLNGHSRAAKLLSTLSSILELYTNLLSHSISKVITVASSAAYDLPTSLWRDLRWYLTAARAELPDVQRAVIEMMYSYIMPATNEDQDFQGKTADRFEADGAIII
ncbi:conserved hypothetical protein [Histoplasma capsulatum H143]|uniref:Uncharacterized protein n=1 Tax=Ajellomyces capsulatus (strain H143) TaxID=544712 RepID=C6HJB2_AJECH|nr:conserved hypothetical protein [Histoplasma capsulatum H143]